MILCALNILNGSLFIYNLMLLIIFYLISMFEDQNLVFGIASERFLCTAIDLLY